MIWFLFQQALIGLTNIALDFPDPADEVVQSIDIGINSVNALFTQVHNMSFIFPVHFMIMIFMSILICNAALFLAASFLWILRMTTLGVVK